MQKLLRVVAVQFEDAFDLDQALLQQCRLPSGRATKMIRSDQSFAEPAAMGYSTSMKPVRSSFAPMGT